MATESERLTVGDTPLKLNGDSSRSQQTVLFKNKSNVSLDYGGQDVASGAGFELDPGDAISVTVDNGEDVFIVGPDSTGYRVDVFRQGIQ